MQNSKIIATLVFFAIISCTNKPQDDHGHDHGPNGEHLDGSHSHDPNHNQEVFEITQDSLTADSLIKEEEKNAEPHSHEHSGENGHSH